MWWRNQPTHLLAEKICPPIHHTAWQNPLRRGLAGNTPTYKIEAEEPSSTSIWSQIWAEPVTWKDQITQKRWCQGKEVNWGKSREQPEQDQEIQKDGTAIPQEQRPEKQIIPHAYLSNPHHHHPRCSKTEIKWHKSTEKKKQQSAVTWKLDNCRESHGNWSSPARSQSWGPGTAQGRAGHREGWKQEESSRVSQAQPVLGRPEVYLSRVVNTIAISHIWVFFF